MATLASTDTAFLDFPGEMARLIREKDWSETPFGPIEGWSTALRSAVSIILGSRFPMVLYWGESRALIYNDAWAPVPGQKHPWALGRPGYEVWAEIWDIIGPMFDQVMHEGVATWSEDQLLPLNRFGYVEECYFYYSYSPVRGEDGRVEGVFTAVTETTYRVLAERRERLLREISEAASLTRSAAAACEVALDRLATLPEEAPYMLAYLRDGETGQYCSLRRDPRIPPNDRIPDSIMLDDPDRGAWFGQAAQTGAPVLIENIRERLGADLPGHPWPEPVEQCLVVPILSPRPGTPHGFLVPALSARRRYDAEYGTLFERIAGFITAAITNAEAYAEERRRTEQLAELDRAKTAFFSNASHEFRTPLTLMLGPVEDMLEGADDAGRLSVDRDQLKLVQRNGQRLLRLVNTLLDFSRIEAGRVRAAFQPTDLAAYTRDLASAFQSTVERAGLALLIDAPPLPEPIWVDREMWEKIVLNLVSNAFKYTMAGGITVSVSASDAGAVLSVADTGVGIPEAELPRVFERFHRVEGQVGRTHEGTGIGLALVRDLVQLHGGAVSATSLEGQGTTFAVTVPFGRAHVPSDGPDAPPPSSTATRADMFVAEARRWIGADEPAATPGEDAFGRSGRGETVLLADDNADMRGYVERLLSEAGYAVTAVADGQEAAERAAAALPDLVLSDVMMPRLDGFGLLKRLRGDERTADLPIILLSARAGEEASIEGLEAGADDYLVKPFSARELLARVEGALRLARARRDTADALRDANEALEGRVLERTQERDRTWALSRDLIGVADSAGVWRSVNPAWERALGWSVADLVGRTSEWLEHPDDRDKTRAEIAALADGQETVEFENRFRRKDGGYAVLNWTAVPEGDLLYCIARDVTAERATEEALRQAQKMEAVGQLTGGIAHDFNNLLTGITGSLELLQVRLAQGRQADADRYVNAAQGAARRAAALTHRLLAFSRRQTLAPKPTDVKKLVGGMEELIARTVGPAIQLETINGAGLWLCLIDPSQLENAILNLCINARDAMPDGGRITIETTNRWMDERAARSRGLQVGQYVSVCVSDTGTGMPPEVIAKAFEPFFTTKPIGQGTGLGLSMIYGFAKQSGGTVSIYSEPGQGTNMCIYLPRFVGEEGEEVASRDGVVPGAEAGETVLVVDDEPTVRMLVAEVLEDLGYAALEAADGPAGLRVLQSAQRVDLLVTDVGLPGGMNGRQVADAARGLRPGLKVLFITGYAENAVLSHGHLDPGMHVLTKPFAMDALGNRIRDILAG